eukprot:gene7589-14998_t
MAPRRAAAAALLAGTAAASAAAVPAAEWDAVGAAAWNPRGHFAAAADTDGAMMLTGGMSVANNTYRVLATML